MNNSSRSRLAFGIENYIFSLTFLLYLFRTAIPFLKFPFLVFYLFSVIYVIIEHRKRIFPSIVEFVRIYFLANLLTAILLVSFLFSNKLYLSIFKDVINTFILLSFFYILNTSITTKLKLNVYINCFIYLIISFALGISILRLVDLFNIFQSEKVFTLYQIPYTKEVGSMPIDYNFAILPIFFGIVSVVYVSIRNGAYLNKFFANLFLIIFATSIFFAGSRRGIIILSVFILILFAAQFFTFLKKESIIKKIGESTRFFLLSIIILFFTSMFLTLNTSYSTKNKLLKAIGSKNLVLTKGEIAFTLFRYVSIINSTKSYTEIYDKVWSPVFNPKDPDSGWGSRIHKTIFPLRGENVEIVPPDAKGYLIDCTSNVDTLNGNAYSSTWISNLDVDTADILEASVFCYVSSDCDVSVAEICALGIMGNPGALYNLENKGTWQKLTFKINCKKGNTGVLLYLLKSNVVDLSSMKGYLIYAYPLVSVTKRKNFNQSLLMINSSIKMSDKMEAYNSKALYQFNFLSQTKNHFSQIATNYLEDYKTIDHILKINDVSISNWIYSTKRFEANICNLNGLMTRLPIFIIRDHDVIRKIASSLISEDTTYFAFSNKIVIDTMSNSFLGGRTVRWHFAAQIFLKEFNFKQKIFGGGFSFLNWFGYVFLKDKRLDDYPHNPFLSILLYSGILGLIIYLLLLNKVFRYYLKFLKEFPTLFIFFFITFFFAFFSAGSPFDPPVMGFFILLPFFIHSIHKKDTPILTEKLANAKNSNNRDK